MRAAIGGFEQSARCRARIVHARLARLAGDRDHAITVGPDESPVQIRVELGIETLGVDNASERNKQQREATEKTHSHDCRRIEVSAL